MKTTIIAIAAAAPGVRLNPAMRAALDKCAAADERPISVMAHKIIADYLRGNGWLK